MTADLLPVRRALLSVSDKTGLVELATALAARGVELLSTGGTAKAIRDAGLAVKDVAEVTGFPEMMDGRVKTLHPTVHGGLLGRSGLDDAVMAEHGIGAIDLLVLNLYPFESVTAQADCTLADAVENIDIGGPAMLRSAAKNFARVAVATDPSQYAELLASLEANNGQLTAATRFAFSVAAFNRVAQYDAAISNYLSAVTATDAAVPARAEYPAQMNSTFVKVMDLRYGENPHQSGAFYRDLYPVPGTLATFQQLQGKELSYNNLADADAAWECVRQFDAPACVIVKHANPCGVAVGAGNGDAYELAYATDPTSAFGGIIAFNKPLDAATAKVILDRQVREVQRDRLCQGQPHHRCRCRPDEPRVLGPHRRHQGRRCEPGGRGLGDGLRRLLPVPRWHRCRCSRRHQGGHPAGRFDARCRSDRRRRRTWPGHGVHRRAPLPPLIRITKPGPARLFSSVPENPVP